MPLQSPLDDQIAAISARDGVERRFSIVEPPRASNAFQCACRVLGACYDDVRGHRVLWRPVVELVAADERTTFAHDGDGDRLHAIGEAVADRVSAAVTQARRDDSDPRGLTGRAKPPWRQRRNPVRAPTSESSLKDRQNNPPICVVGGVAVWSRKCGRCQVRCRCKRRRFAVEVRRFGAAGNDGSVSGRGWAGRQEVRHSVAAPVGAVRRWSVMGGAGLRGARTERWCAGGVDATGLAGGEMSEDPLDELRSVDARDDAQRAATHTTVFDVDVEDALEALHPAHGGWRRMGFAGGWVSTVGDDVVAVFEVRGEHAMVSGEMSAGAWYEGSEAGDKVHRVEHDMSRPVMEGVLEPIHDLRAVIDREAFVRDCWAGDVAATSSRTSTSARPTRAKRPQRRPTTQSPRRFRPPCCESSPAWGWASFSAWCREP